MHRVGYLLSEGFQVMAIGTQTVFEMANVVMRERVYSVTNYSLAGGDVQASLGIFVKTQPIVTGKEADTWMISGTVDPTQRPTPPEERDFVRTASQHSRRTAGLCTGAFILADAGLLDGKQATTHWAFAAELQARYPTAHIDAERIFVTDGAIWTSAGLTAAMDMALRLVEDDLGHEIATRVAHVLVMNQRRGGAQPQRSEMLKLAPKSDRIQTALEYARQNLAQPLRIEDLARVASLSARQFQRIFQAETGHSPAKAIAQLRMETARNMIERGRHPLEVIARETGFRDRDHLREAFFRAYGTSPQALRREARNSRQADQ